MQYKRPSPSLSGIRVNTLEENMIKREEVCCGLSVCQCTGGKMSEANLQK